MNTYYLMEKKNFHLFYKVFVETMLHLVSRFIFPFFCSDSNLEVAVVKADKIRGLKQLFTRFLLSGKKNSKIINNYHIAHQKTT